MKKPVRKKPTPMPRYEYIFQDVSFTHLEAVFTPKAYKAFGEWMYGQTCPVGPNGECMVYGHDLERWVSQHFAGRKFATVQGSDWD